jgi:pimeloyl-ACP methyl ester carboxylesterase
MKILNGILIIILLTSQIFGQQKDLSGSWSGKLELPNSMKLTVVFHLERDSNGMYTATMDSPDQGAKGIPTESTTIMEDSILIKIPAVKGFYKGKIFTDSMQIDGKWKQSGMTLNLIIKKVDKIEEANRPQEPKEPYPYKSEDVTFENKIDSVTLAGTLTLPDSGENFPAVVLITGSGAQNRNEELLGHKPFLVIADYLTRNGFAVLRYDDRGYAKSTGNFASATTEDFVIDALAAVEYLKGRSEIDHSKIGLMGHSEGGLIAPMAAVKSSDVAFIIMLAGPGLPGDSILILQSELIQKVMGNNYEDIQKSLSINRKIFSLIKNSNDDENLKKQINEVLNSEISKMTDEEKSKMGDTEAYVNQQIKTLTSPWFKYFVKYDPRPTLEKVKCPVLAIDGENDLQVPAKQNLASIESVLKKGGNENFETVLLPGLNHLFQTSKTGAVSEYGTIEETIAPKALVTILVWLKKTTE